MADYNASIGLNLTDGVSPALSNLDKRLTELEGHFSSLEKTATTATNKVASGSKDLEQSVIKTTQSVRGAEQALASLSGGSLSTAMTGISSLAGGFSGASVALGLVALGAYAVVKAIGEMTDQLKDAVKTGVAAADNLTNIAIGMAGVINNTKIFTDANGRALEGMNKFNAALAVSGQATATLHDASLKYGLDLNSMARAFDLTQSKMSAANISLKDQLDLITKLTLAGKAAGLDPASIPQQIQMLMSGNVGARNKIAGILGITSEDAKNVSALLDTITPKMGSITKAVELQNQTWTEGLKLVKENYESVLEDAMKPLATELGSFTKDLLDFLNKPDVKEAFKDMGKNLTEAFHQIKPLLIDMAETLVKITGAMAWLANQATKGYGDKGPVGVSPKVYKDVYGGGAPVYRNEKGEVVNPDGSPAWFAAPPVGSTIGMSASYGSGLGVSNKPLEDSQAVKYLIEQMKEENKILADTTDLQKALDTATKEYNQTIHDKITDNKEYMTDAAKKAIMDEAALTRQLKDSAAYQAAADAKIAADKRVADAGIRYNEQQQKAQDNYVKVMADSTRLISDLQKHASDSAITNFYAERDAAIDAINDRVTKEKIAIDRAIAEKEKELQGPLDPATLKEAEDKKTKIAEAGAAARTQIYKDYTLSALALAQMEAQGQLDILLKRTDDFVSGVKAGLLKIAVAVKSTTESVSEFVSSVWNSMANAFETGFYDVLTGDISDLKNVFKSLWDSILKDFSKMLTQMLEKWLIFGDEAQNGSAGGTGVIPKLIGSLLGSSGQTAYSQIPMGTSYSQVVGDSTSSNGWGAATTSKGGIGAGVLGIAGLAAGLVLNNTNALSANNQQYTIAGQANAADFGRPIAGGIELAAGVAALVAMGTAIAAVGTAALASTAALVAAVPVYGWIAAAAILVVGAVLAIINGPKEAVVKMYTNQMGNNTAVGQAMQGVYGAYSGQLSDINRLGGGSTTDFSKYMNANNNEWMKQWQISLHAGSGDDLTKDANTFFKTILPKLTIEHAFGQTFNGQYHGDTAGGLPGQEGIAGISGVPQFIGGSFDPNAPIPKMLAGLGLTAKAITGIARQIDLRDPDAFIAWLNRVVAVVAGFKDTVTNLNKSWQDIEKDMADAKKGGVNPALAAAQQNVVDLASEIGNYTGDEQLTKMEELKKASDDYYNQALAAVQALITMMHQVNQQANDFNKNISTFQDAAKKNPDWLAGDRTRFMSSTSSYNAYQQLAGAQSADDVQTIWNNFMATAADQLKYLEDLYNQAAAGLKNMKALATSFDTIFTDASTNYMDINQLWSDLGGIQKNIGLAAKQTGQQQLDTLALVGQSTTDLYQHLLAYIQAVNSAQTSLTQGTTADIWQNNYAIAGNNDKTGNNTAQKTMIRDKIVADMGVIGTATDPTQVTQYAAEIRGLLHTYQGFFKAGDPGYNTAYTWSNTILTQLQDLGTAVLSGGDYNGQHYVGMGQSAAQIARELGTGGETMQSAQDLFQGALDTATTALDALKTSVDDFKTAVDAKLGTWATDITDQMKAAGTALTKAMDDFTKALGGTDSTGTTPPKRPAKDLDDLGVAVQNLTVKVNALTDKI